MEGRAFPLPLMFARYWLSCLRTIPQTLNAADDHQQPIPEPRTLQRAQALAVCNLSHLRRCQTFAPSAFLRLRQVCEGALFNF
jgi:hypothetical protein